jgi:hypothetical protein
MNTDPKHWKDNEVITKEEEKDVIKKMKKIMRWRRRNVP